ncbi:HAD family hydrolase, partial [Paenibacillus polymyxa]|uniref:HAD family hydrolase n=2 Tax=Paenibacillus TaxID=44249 RepID=UPI003EB90581
NYLSKPRIFLDSKSFFRDCKLPVYIVSNIDNDNINEAIKFHDIHVSGVLSSEDARSYKPRPELFKKALKEFNLRPEEVVYIGDSLRSDVMGSHKAGLKCIWLNRKNSINLFVKPNYTINNLSILTEVLEG